MKLNKISKLNKTSKTHIFVYVFALLRHGSVLKSRPMVMSYTTQMQQQMASFKQKVSIFVQISLFFNWVPHEKLH